MKTINAIVKILTALATIAGIVYIIATYGDQIVAWAKKILASCPCKCKTEDCADSEGESENPCEEAVEEAPAEEAVEEVVEEVVVEEAPTEEAAPKGNEPVADEADFAE